MKDHNKGHGRAVLHPWRLKCDVDYHLKIIPSKFETTNHKRRLKRMVWPSWNSKRWLTRSLRTQRRKRGKTAANTVTTEKAKPSVPTASNIEALRTVARQSLFFQIKCLRQLFNGRTDRIRHRTHQPNYMAAELVGVSFLGSKQA